MNNSLETKNPSLGTKKSSNRIAFVQATWHRDIVDQLRDSFAAEFKTLKNHEVDFFEVSGAYEIPLYIQKLFETGKYDCAVAAGLVVDGGIYRHEFVAQAVIDGLMRVGLDSGKPVFSAVLTPHDFSTEEQQAYFKEHFVMKGKEVAHACASTLQSLSVI